MVVQILGAHFPTVEVGSFSQVSRRCAFLTERESLVVDLLFIDFVVKTDCARSGGVLKRGKPSFSFEERSPLQVPVVPVRVFSIELGRIGDIIGV